MKSLLIKAFNARPEEFTSIGLMMLLGFSTGIFIATYDVAAPALFLAQFEDKNTLAQAILLSGILSVFSTYLYALLQRKIPFQYLVWFFMLIILAATAFIWFQSRSAEVNKTVIFIAFVLSLPFSFASSLIFWGYFGRVFNLKQSKRVIGGIDTGQLVASILSLFAIGFLLDNNIVITEQLYIGSVVGVIGVIVVATFINPLVGKSAATAQKVKSQSFIKIFGNRYTKWMTLFVIVSLIAITFIDYSFLNVTNIQWTTVAEKGSFLAKFEATVVIFSFLFQTFVTDWLIENYGLKVSLLINPILAIVLAGVALVAGIFMGADADAGGNFIWFFLAIAAGKLFIDSLKDALDGPTFKLYFLPIDSEVKFDVTTKIEGVITAIGGVIAGLILIGMNRFNIELLFVSAGLIPMLIFWYFITNRMHSGYRSTLQYTLEKNKNQSGAKGDNKNSKHIPEAQVINNLKVLERTSPGEFEKTALSMLESVDGNVQSFLKSKIKEMELEFDTKPSSIDKNEELKKLASSAIDEANQSDVISISPDRLYTLSKSVSKEDRILAAKLLRSLISDKSIFVLLELLRDQNIEVKKQAIVTARKVKRKETWPLLIELLSNRTFTYDASSALIEAGEEVLPSLENAFHRSGQVQSVMLKIINIIGSIDTPEANKILWGKIDFPDRKIVRQILLSFNDKRFSANESEIIVLNDLLSDEIGKAIWNMAALDELTDESHNDLLKDALNEEVKSNFSMIYILLSMIYDPESIKLVKENIESGTAEGNTFALELLDIFIAQDLKPKLFPLLDDIDTREKLTKLQHFYPRQSYEEATTYNFLLNRDFNNINRWTKACTLYAIQSNLQEEVKKSVVAQMFNPDPLLAELAASILYKYDKTVFNSITARRLLQDKSFGEIVERLEANQPTKFEVCRFFAQSEAFQSLSGLHISQIVDKADLVEVGNDESITITDEQNTYLVASGSFEVSTSNHTSSQFDEGSTFGNMFSDKTLELTSAKAVTNAKVFVINLNEVFDVLTNYKALTKVMVNTISHSMQLKFEKTVNTIH